MSSSSVKIKIDRLFLFLFLSSAQICLPVQPVRAISLTYELPLTPFTQEETHKCWSSSSPILCRWWFNTERSISALKTNRREFTQKAGAAAPTEVWRYTSWWWRRCVFKVFPQYPPVILTPSLAGMEAIFWGKVHWSLCPDGWLSQWFVFITITQWVKVFWRWQMLFFGQTKSR